MKQWNICMTKTSSLAIKKSKKVSNNGSISNTHGLIGLTEKNGYPTKVIYTLNAIFIKIPIATLEFSIATTTTTKRPNTKQTKSINQTSKIVKTILI